MTQKEIKNFKEQKYDTYEEYGEACSILKSTMNEAYARGNIDLGDTLANALMTVQVRATKELSDTDKMKFIANYI